VNRTLGHSTGPFPHRLVTITAPAVNLLKLFAPVLVIILVVQGCGAKNDSHGGGASTGTGAPTSGDLHSAAASATLHRDNFRIMSIHRTRRYSDPELHFSREPTSPKNELIVVKVEVDNSQGEGLLQIGPVMIVDLNGNKREAAKSLLLGSGQKHEFDFVCDAPRGTKLRSIDLSDMSLDLGGLEGNGPESRQAPR